jgi:uncharacterized DUF497 family protein
MTVFADWRGLDGADLKHSRHEPRFFLVGQSTAGRVLTIIYTLRSRAHGETVRLISARRANRKECAAYALE